MGVGVVVALGLVSRRVHVGFLLWDKSLGDALYTVLLYLLFVVARPGAAPRPLGGSALAASIAIELFQLTGIPARAPRLVQIALGTTFSWHDVACYVLGAAAATGAHLVALDRRARVRQRKEMLSR